MWKSVERTGEKVVNELETPMEKPDNHQDYIMVPANDDQPLTNKESESEI